MWPVPALCDGHPVLTARVALSLEYVRTRDCPVNGLALEQLLVNVATFL